MGTYQERLTVRGYPMMDVVSAMQKAIRRGDAKLAAFWACELYESGMEKYCWRRLYIISAEDCWGAITNEIEALHHGWELVQANPARGHKNGRVFVVKAALLLAMARKCRDADHASNLLYDRKLGITDDELLADLEDAQRNPPAIPDYAFDVHTQSGRARGKTRDNFFRDEFEALRPRQPGLFDHLVP